MQTFDKNCSLAHGMSTGYPRNADWQQVTKWMHLNASITLAIIKSDSFLSDSHFKQYQRLK